MRSLDPHPATWLDEAMELLHTADHVTQVLDHVNGAESVETAVRERIGKAVEIADNVGCARGIDVDSD
ncbi:MAG TPA: hypothetical protein VG273_21485 [Bryobacteraceae bacterium]|nr:hypothetical protein [Bryobacteraceae bacterium]